MPMTVQQARIIDPALSHHARGYCHPARAGRLLLPSVDVTVSGGKVMEFGKESFRRYSDHIAAANAIVTTSMSVVNSHYRTK